MWEQTSAQLELVKDDIVKQAKRAIKKKLPKSVSIRDDIRDSLTDLFNEFTRILAVSWENLDNNQKLIANQLFLKIRDLVVRSFQALSVKYKVPVSCIQLIDPRILEEESEDEDSDNGGIMAVSAMDFFNLAGKIISSEFDGSLEKFPSFLDALELLKCNTGDHTANAVAFVKTRLIGKARALITVENNIDDIITALKNGIKGESSSSLASKMLNFKQNSRDTVSYSTSIESLAEKLKRSFISEGVPAQVAEKYTTETTVKALSKNASLEKTRWLMEAGTFNNVQEVITKFINSNSQTADANVLNFRGNNKFNNGFRGQRHYNYYNNRNNFTNPRNSQTHGRGRGNFNNFNRGNRFRGNSFREGNYSQRVRLCGTSEESGNFPDPQQQLGEI